MGIHVQDSDNFESYEDGYNCYSDGGQETGGLTEGQEGGSYTSDGYDSMTGSEASDDA